MSGVKSTINCPNCGLSHDAEVLKCDCGYDLQKAKAAKINSNPSAAAEGEFLILRICRVLYLIGVGIITVVLFVGIIGDLILSGIEGVFKDIGSLLASAAVIILLLGSYGTITLLLSDHKRIGQLIASIRDIKKNMKS